MQRDCQLPQKGRGGEWASNPFPLSRVDPLLPRKTVSVVTHDIESQAVLNNYFDLSKKFRLGQWFTRHQDVFNEAIKSPPDAILMNVRLPDVCGIQCAHDLKRLHPRLIVVMMAKEIDISAFLRAFQAGADGYFVSPGTLEAWERILSDALTGWKPFSRELQKLVVERLGNNFASGGGTGEFTQAEHDVMSCLVLAESDKQISSKRGTSLGTTHAIMNGIFKKLGVHNRRQAVNAYLGFKRTQFKEPTAVSRLARANAVVPNHPGSLLAQL